MGIENDILKSTVTSQDYEITDLDFAIGGSDIQRMNSFIYDLRQQPTTLKQGIRIETQKEARIQIEKIGFDKNTYLLAAREENTTITHETKPTFGYQYIDALEYAGKLIIGDRAIEDYRASKRADFVSSMRAKLTEGLSIDIDKLLWRSDSTSTIPVETYQEGIQKLAASGTVIDAAAGVLTEDMLDEAINSMPDDYQTGMIKFFMPRNMIQQFKGLARARNTPLGDSYYTGNANLLYDSMSIVLAPYMGTYSNGGYTCSDIIFTDPRNIILGFQRFLSFESERDAANSAYNYYYRLRFGIAIEETSAIVKIKNVRVVS